MRLHYRPRSRPPEGHIYRDCAWCRSLAKSLVVLVKGNCERPGHSYESALSLRAAAIVINRMSIPASTACGKDCDWRVWVAQPRSTRGDAALHRAVNAGLQKADLGLAVERAERRLQQLGAEPCRPDIFDRRPLGLVPADL